MRTSDYPFLADWLAISLRWLALVGLLVGLWIGGTFSVLTGLPLALALLWNLAMTVLALVNRRINRHRLINIAVDSLIALLLFVLSGDVRGPIAWAGTMALFSAAIYYEWWGTLATFGGLVVAETGWQALQLGSSFSWGIAGALATINLLVGGVIAFLSHRLLRYMRETYLRVIRQRKEAEQKARVQEHDRMQTFYGMIEALSATLDFQVVLETSLDLAATAIGNQTDTDQLVSAVLLFDNQDLVFATSRHVPQIDMRLRMPADSGLLKKALQTGAPVVSENPAADPELQAMVSLRECDSIVLLPLLRGMNAYGVMLFAHPMPGVFNTERMEMLEMISHQAVVAIQNARLFQDIQAEKERIIETQEEARKKLARDLHDGPTQSVSAIAMRVSIARRLLERDVNEANDELIKIEDLARRTTHEIRHMLFTLRPLVLESEGLVATLQAMAEKMRELYQQNVVIDIDSQVILQLDAAKQTIIFYLAEEATNNARKHAQAAQITVRLKFLPQNSSLALLEIVDNGVGFDLNAVNSSYDRRGSLGMVNLRERADLINSVLRIDSAPGKGTRVQVLIPLTDEAVERLQRGAVAANPER